MYVIKKRQYYVAKSEMKNSYTTLLRNARLFKTFKEAEEERCGNERVVPLQNELSYSIPRE